MNILIGSQAIYCRNNFWGTALYFPELARKEIRLLWEFPNRVKIQTCYVGSMWHQLQHVYNRYTLKMVDKNSFQQYWSLWWGRLRGPGPWQSNNNHHGHTHPQPWELKIRCACWAAYCDKIPSHTIRESNVLNGSGIVPYQTMFSWFKFRYILSPT